MFQITLQTIEVLMHQYGYIVFFILAVIEGPITTVVASFMASTGFFNIFIIYTLSVLGDVAGDLLYYFIGHLFRNQWKNRDKFLFISRDRINQVKEHFNLKAGRTFLTAKLTHGVGFTVLVAAGISEVPMSIFIPYSFLGTLPKSLFFVFLGFYFGRAYYFINDYINTFSLAVFAIFVLVLGFVFYKKSRSAV